MALNPTFASASVNPSQSMGSDASAPAQGALPTGMPQNTGFSGLGGQANQPMTPYASFGGGLDIGSVAPQEPVVPMIPNFNQSYYQSPQYQSYLNNLQNTVPTDDHRMMPFGGFGSGNIAGLQNQSYEDFLKNPSMGQQPNIQEKYGVPSPFMNQGAMLPDADRKEMNPDYVIPKYTAQDVQTAMKNPEFDSGYYQKANIIDDQGNPISAQARQQLIQPFYNQVEQSMQYGPQVPYQDPQGLIGPSLSPIGLPQFTSPQQTTPPPPPAIPSPPPQATPTGTTPMATNPLSTYATTPTANAIPAPTLNATPGSASSGSFGQGAVLPNVTTTQQQITAAPSFYTDYLNQLATQGGQAAQNAQYVGAQPLQEQAFNLSSQNVGNYQPTLQNAINLASSVGNTNLAQAIGDVGQANIARNLAPQATAGIVGSGQFGSKRGAQALGDVIANAELGLTAQQQQAMQQDMANRIAAAQQLGTLANSTQQLGLGDVNALSTLGQQQQTIAQNQQLFPMQQLANQSALLRGYTIPTSVSASQTGPGQQGQFQTSPLQQIMSVGTLLGALAKPTADYIDPKTGLLVKGTSAGENILSGLGTSGTSLLKYLNSIGGKTGSSGTNSTLNPDTNLPNGIPAGSTYNPKDNTYSDAIGTKYLVDDSGSVTTLNPRTFPSDEDADAYYNNSSYDQ